MVPLLLLLLLLLLPGLPILLLSDEVCFNISDGTVEMKSTNVTVSDSIKNHYICSLNKMDCIIKCTSNLTSVFNGSSDCINATLEKLPSHQNYSIGRDFECYAHLCEKTFVLKLMRDLNTDSAMQRELMELFEIKDSCLLIFLRFPEVKKYFIKLEEKIIHNIMNDSNVEAGDSKTHNLKSFSLNLINISDSDLNLTGTNSTIQIEAPQLLPQSKSFIPEIWLPVDALQHIPQKKRLVGLVSYRENTQFKFNQENILSMVIRIELLGEHRLHNLKTPIKMIFRGLEVGNIDNHSQLLCNYFDVEDTCWRTNGCETYNVTDDKGTGITCICNHTTPFAVLLIREPIAKIHWEILSYISYIGCSLSAFFTALSLVIYVFGRSHKMDYSISIHVSLSGALFLLNTTFLLTEWGAAVEPDWVCVFVAALMHYSLLCCFTWMAIEALHLYLLLIKVYNTYYKHYLLKLSLAGWGIPAVIVGVSLGAKDFKQFYGVTHMTMSDTNQTNSICWITDDSFFYSLNLLYFTLIFVFNSGILVAVASSICKMKQVFRSKSRLGAEGEGGKTWRDPQRLSESCRGGLTVLGLTCLMGTTWGLAFMGSGYVNLPILYLFCILNSTQGFFIFLWICLSAKKQRKREMEDRLSSTPAKNTTLKSD